MIKRNKEGWKRKGGVSKEILIKKGEKEKQEIRKVGRGREVS